MTTIVVPALRRQAVLVLSFSNLLRMRDVLVIFGPTIDLRENNYE